jgi:bifunctional non-homologous end joining protein LigD
VSRAKTPPEYRAEVELTNLDQPLFDGADATKRDLVDYLDAVHERILTGLRDRPLSVIRVRPGQPPFMQKNVPGYAPDWIRTVAVWAEASKREVRYALCNDRRTLLWFANQRAVEYHPTLMLAERHHPTHLILDLDPPADDAFSHVVAAARLVQRALADSGLAGAVKTSGAKGLHVFVPLADDQGVEDVAAATRALAARAERLDPDVATTAFIREDRGDRVFVDSTRAGGATVVAAYRPARPPRAAGVLPGDLGPARRHLAAGLHRAHRARAARRGRPVAGGHAGAAGAARRPGGGGAHHPDRPGAGHARGQAPRPGPAAVAR